MRIFIDADGCPVTGQAVGLASTYHIPCTIICDTSHEIAFPSAQTITVGKGADSADFTLVNLLQKGDLVITQDYGLAAMCLGRGANVLHQDGFFYTEDNIDALLHFRAQAKKARRGGARIKGPQKRAKEQNAAFCTALEAFLREEQA